MLEILKFACSGFFTFIGTWMLISIILYFVVNGIIKISSRFLRLLMILFRGWPPEHLDADGDWKPLKPS